MRIMSRAGWWASALLLLGQLGCAAQIDSPVAVGESQSALASSSGVMLQGFIWGTQGGWWNTISTTSGTIKDGGFTMVWLPPPATSNDVHGYLPTQWNVLSSAYGTQAEMQSAINALHGNGIKALADVVINHRNGTSNWADFSNPSFADNNAAVVNNDEYYFGGNPGSGVPSGNRGGGDSGESYSAARDLDHNNASVQNVVKSWQSTLKSVGFDGWRYDYVKGYGGNFVQTYNNASAPVFSVGEYWPTQSFDQNNPGAWRSTINNWVNATGSTSAAFDYVTKPLLAAALSANNFGLLNNGGVPAGLIGVNPANSVTFIDNHDTGFTPQGQGMWPFPGDKVEQGYAYILTHPGVPCVFWAHYFDWGSALQTAINNMIAIRKSQGISSTSSVVIEAANSSVYAATINGNTAMKIGPGSWSPSGTWTLSLSGTNYAIWKKGGTTNAVTVPARIEAEAYVRFNDADAENHAASYAPAACNRNDAVDIEGANEGGCNIGWTNPGEWLEYDIKAASAGSFDLNLRLASGSAGKSASVYIDGAKVGTLSAPSSGWQTFEDRKLSGVAVGAGNHVLRVQFDTNDVNLNYLDVSLPSAPATSFRVEAESYSSYNDLTSGNSGNNPACTRNDNVDIEATSDPKGGACDVGWGDAGEWLSYSLTPPAAGTYKLIARAASGATGSFNVTLDATTSSNLSVSTGGWQTWVDVTVLPSFYLSQSQHALRYNITGSGMNLNYFELVRIN